MPGLNQATSRPQQSFSGQDVHPGFFRKVAALGHAIVKDHVFANGNKRTALVAMSTALTANGWGFLMPPSVAAFMMIRIAGDKEPMTIDEIEALLASHAFNPKDKKMVASLHKTSNEMLQNGFVTVEEPDVFPVPPPSRSRDAFNEDARAALKRHIALLSPDERKILDEGGTWPITLARLLTRWNHKREHHQWQKHLHRARFKRIGKRRPPHKGGRTVPKVCRPIRNS